MPISLSTIQEATRDEALEGLAGELERRGQVGELGTDTRVGLYELGP